MASAPTANGSPGRPARPSTCTSAWYATAPEAITAAISSRGAGSGVGRTGAAAISTGTATSAAVPAPTAVQRRLRALRTEAMDRTYVALVVVTASVTAP